MADEFDMRAHRGMYGSFTKILTISAAGAVALLILMGLFLL